MVKKETAQISIIVPVYHGQQFISQMIRQTEQCAVQAEDTQVSLIFVNDDPQTPLEEDMVSDKIRIRVLNTTRNYGIHGARARGLDACHSEFVVFLDQDDIIAPSYLRSQLDKIGDADAVVCRLMNDDRLYYDRRRNFHETVSREYVIFHDNPIVSPGQVLLRRDAVPQAWKKNIMEHNGADDWLLWICMFGMGKQFRLNDRVLFEHVVSGNNASWQTEAMMLSEYEVLEMVKREHILKPEEENGLSAALQSKIYARMRLLDKYKRMFYVYDRWLRLKCKGADLFAGLKEDGIRSVAVYGVSDTGRRIWEKMTEEGFFVQYYIDMNAEYLKEYIPVYSPQEALPRVDAVVIALVEQEKQIKEMLREKGMDRVLSVWELSGIWERKCI